MKHSIYIAFLILLSVALPLFGEAPPPPNPSAGGGAKGAKSATLPFLYFGGLVGIAYPPHSMGASSRLNLGGTFQFRISKNLGIGIYYMQSLKQEASGYPIPYDKTMIRIYAYGGELNYWFKWERFAFRLGYRMGPSKIAIEGFANNAGSTEPTHFGPVGSIDYFLGKEVSVGFDGCFLFFGDIIENAPFITYYMNAALKLWF